ncbi:hypothetical protein O5340_02050 [Escherichia coli]|nr:hypothetical protein [Escherichia coli]
MKSTAATTPKRSFLANLSQSDTNAIKIGLTGTPLLGTDYNSRDLFGDYIHKYYYNASIADGYTLRLIREEIATNYRMILQQALKRWKSEWAMWIAKTSTPIPASSSRC